jgi:hypothetical protein
LVGVADGEAGGDEGCFGVLVGAGDSECVGFLAGVEVGVGLWVTTGTGGAEDGATNGVGFGESRLR